MSPKLLLTLLSIVTTTLAFTAQFSGGAYKHYLDVNGTEVVEKIGDISAEYSSTISKRQSANSPSGRHATCPSAWLSSSNLYGPIWSANFNGCGSGVGGGQ